LFIFYYIKMMKEAGIPNFKERTLNNKYVSACELNINTLLKSSIQINSIPLEGEELQKNKICAEINRIEIELISLIAESLDTVYKFKDEFVDFGLFPNLHKQLHNIEQLIKKIKVYVLRLMEIYNIENINDSKEDLEKDPNKYIELVGGYRSIIILVLEALEALKTILKATEIEAKKPKLTITQQVERTTELSWNYLKNKTKDLQNPEKSGFNSTNFFMSQNKNYDDDNNNNSNNNNYQNETLSFGSSLTDNDTFSPLVPQLDSKLAKNLVSDLEPFFLNFTSIF